MDSFKLIVLVVIFVIRTTSPLRLPHVRDTRFERNYAFLWGKLINRDSEVELVLDKQFEGAGFRSKTSYLFGHISMKIKLAPRDSAGTVTTFYLSSQKEDYNDIHDEIDFEFLGNVSGQPYIAQTNIFVRGTGNREQRIYLWFDPTEDFHTYAILWNQEQIVFYIDDKPIRVYKRNEARGIPFPNMQLLGIYSTIFNGSAWATRGGADKLNWDHAPFVATYKGFNVDACSGTVEVCSTVKGRWWNKPEFLTSDRDTMNDIALIKKKYMVYDYCKDFNRYPKAPPECALNP